MKKVTITVCLLVVIATFTSNINLRAQEDYTFTQLDDEWGIVSMEAEHYTEMEIQTDSYFEETFEPDLFSGDGAMLAVSPGPYATADEALASSAILNYTVDFVRADTVFIWMRGFHEGGSDDSFHAGIDYVITEDTHRIGYHGDPTGDWEWLGINMNSTKPKFYIDGPGQHIFQVFIRENGLKIDKIVLTTDREYDPLWFHGDFGPEETLANVAVETIGNAAEFFHLDHNYPNPFNPETTISYSLPHAEHVTLTVFNYLGKKIKTLVNDYKASGQYQVSWNGQDDNGLNVASGVYVYRITTGSFAQSHKMLLAK